MASPYMYKPLVWKRFVGLKEICWCHCGTFQPKKFTILLTSLTHSTLQISTLLVKYHPNALFFLILRFLRDLAFQLIKYWTCKHISSLLKVFNIHTFHLATLQTAKRVEEKHYMYSCFIYCKNFIFRFSHFESHPKTVNIQGYFELQEPIRTHENCYPLIWWILILGKFMRQDLWRVYTFWWCSSSRQLYPGTRTCNGTWFTLFPNPNQ